MKKEIIHKLHSSFEDVVHEQDGIEFWLARDLQVLLGYDEWRNFAKVIEKAKEASKNVGQDPADHFVEANKLITHGKGGQRSIVDFMLTRYACYLIAQNGDPAKEPIAFAQTYFAVQTRKQELIEERLQLMERLQAREKLETTETELSRLIYERGGDRESFARIRSKGDAALFGGRTTKQMKQRMGMPDNRPIADFLPTITVKAKDFAAEITNHNVKQANLHGEPAITGEHVRNNTEVRNLLVKRGIKPEDLPPEEDIRKLERRIKAEEKKRLERPKGLAKGKILNPKNVSTP